MSRPIIAIAITTCLFLILVLIVFLVVYYKCYRQRQISDYTIEILLKNDIGSVIQALEVFEVPSMCDHIIVYFKECFVHVEIENQYQWFQHLLTSQGI